MQKQTFETGAVRDSHDNKPRLDLISPVFLLAVSEWLRRSKDTQMYLITLGSLYHRLQVAKEDPTIDNFCSVALYTSWCMYHDTKHWGTWDDWMSPVVAERLGSWLERGARRYAERNWEKGIPISRSLASLERHLNKWRAGIEVEGDDLHPVAVLCNACFIIHTMVMCKRGLLPASLIDLPNYIKQPVAECSLEDYDELCGCKHCRGIREARGRLSSSPASESPTPANPAATR